MLFDILQVAGMLLLGAAIFVLAVIAVLIVSCAVSVGWSVGHSAVIGAALAKAKQQR